MVFYATLISIYKENTSGSTKPNVHVIYFRDLRFNFYFMIYRPQAKRNKEHEKLMYWISERHWSINRWWFDWVKSPK